MKVVTDQCQREVTLPDFPARIISVVPSQTELLFDLKLGERVVGITKFCVHPDSWFRGKPHVGGTKNLNFDRIYSLKPDLIIANKEENTKQEIERLAADFPVWISDVKSLADATAMIASVASITGTSETGEKLIDYIETAFGSMQPLNEGYSALYLIWKEPWMSVNHDTFIHDMMKVCGLVNCTAEFSDRYPVLSDMQIRELNPDLILLSSEPFPFSEKHILEIKRLAPKARIGLVDGESFSWYGSRLCQTPFYLQKLINLW